MTEPPVLAIDFGTSNSYFCRAAAQPPAPVGLDLSGTGRDGIATAICYRRDQEPLVGDEAFEEFGDATPAERRAYRLCTRFKPDIATDPAAREAARDFFTTLLEQSRRRRKDLAPLAHQVLVGVPCGAAPAYRETLAGLFREAGFGAVRQVEEPKGALLYQLHHRRLSARDAMQGVLAVDFGGGTCDFAFLRQGRVSHAWGAPRLGGRLFDDLFYRWFLDTHPDAAGRLAGDQADFWFHARVCREAKEHFSRTMARSRQEPVRHDAGRYGRFVDLTWTAFVERATAYRPTDRLEAGGHPAAADVARRPDGSIDLLEWFRATLLSGIRDGGLSQGDVHHVVLCGGSSQWPFVADALRETLGVPDARIVCSDRPVATISEGLALLPALERRFDLSRKALREELPAFMRQQVLPRVNQLLLTAADAVASAAGGAFFDREIAARLRAFREQGGTAGALQEDLNATVRAYDETFRGLVASQFTRTAEALPLEVHRELVSWFGRQGLAAPLPDSERLREPLQPALPLVAMPGFFNDLADLAGVLAGIVSFLLIQGPGGWLAGGLLALTTRHLGRRRASGWMAKRTVPRWLRQRRLGEDRIARIREECIRQTREAVLAASETLREELLQRLQAQIENEITALNEFCELAPWR